MKNNLTFQTILKKTSHCKKHFSDDIFSIYFTNLFDISSPKLFVFLFSHPRRHNSFTFKRLLFSYYWHIKNLSDCRKNMKVVTVFT